MNYAFCPSLKITFVHTIISLVLRSSMRLICTLYSKSVIKYYTRQNSPVYTCFLDASKAFDRISHWTLFKKLIACNTPVLIVRILMFWYQRQSICVKWGKRTPEYFSIINRVRQGSVLSPQLFVIYMNDLSVCLT